MNKYYRISLTSASLYEEIRISIDTMLGLPSGRADTWFPSIENATKDDQYIYAAVLQEHYEIPQFKNFVDNLISNKQVEEITQNDWIAAIESINSDE